VRKGEATRERIAARAAEVFNVRGVAGASLADLMAATGLQKGGIYNHFASKEQLALAAFDHAAAVLERRFAPAWEAGGLATLRAFVETFRSYGARPPLAGGCPVLNTAVESDDTDPLLRDRARAVAEAWRARLVAAVAAGKAAGEIRPGVDAEALATVLVATLEGGLMLTKLAGNPAHLEHAAAHLLAYLDAAVAA
jgi:TetR/AcrR family transcriptional regulator, transcriptional repressor for nem operon